MGVNGELGLRLPDLEWAVRANAGALQGVGWVDFRLDTHLPPMRVVGHENETKFRGYAYLTVLPNYIAEDTLAAQHRGSPTAWEALTLVFARAGWTVASRSHLWAPYSPYPGVLAKMVEAFGVERAVHKFNPDRLSRLAAMLPSWYPSRGRLDSAMEVLAACGIADEAGTSWSQDNAPLEALKDEVLCCHSAEWWRARQAEGASPSYKLSNGFLRFQPAEGAGFPLRREDCLVVIGEDGKLSLALHRLLPAWNSVRITTNEGPEPGSIPAPAPTAEAVVPPPQTEVPAAQTGQKAPTAQDQKATAESKDVGQGGQPAEEAPPEKKKKGKAAEPAASTAAQVKVPAEAKGAKPRLAAPTAVPDEELEDDATQDALVPMDEEAVEELALGDEDDLLEFEEVDLLEIEAEPDEDPPTDPGSTKTEKPASRREKGGKSTKKDEK